ncbi:NAD-dependent epimerase/dehydratase family protein [Psychromicrobium lacuslunae]|uniref:NAD-dependent dehydratase n=1 Tax=Psychromicrobium lacuslunae TaxID=1618207 RepID=A0A0D4BW93_9MICC|nr:NAD-dependent epimerase/dehydratase family protein [Psychromicrobium lacuslunae]AJT40564.1 NAD-dependent dehydratase [Psychromicrobium lacuslunae]
MRLLITGGAGFIGLALAKAALRAGWQVRLLDSLAAEVHCTAPPIPAGAELIKASVNDPSAVRRALRGVDAVSHQAAKVGLGVSFQDAPDYVTSNVGGTAVLLAGMAEAGVKNLVLASSMVVYGEGVYYNDAGAQLRPAARLERDLAAGIFEPRDPQTGKLLSPGLVDEDARLDPRNVYASSKLAQEHLAANWSRETGSRAIALRYHNVYGVGMPQNTPYSGVASIFRSALARGEAPRVFEDGQQRRSFVDVQDVAAANLACLDQLTESGPEFRAYNVGAERVHTIGELATALSQALDGVPPIITGEYRLGDVRHITASSARIRRELGWRPQLDFEAGIRQFARAPLRPSATSN